MELGLEGKVCVVTGASRGIGREVARELCRERARVLFVGRDAERLREASADCGGDYLAIDVTDPMAADQVVATCAEQTGGIDVLVNNAGTMDVRTLDELTDDDWRQQLDLGVMAPMRLMRAAAPRMAAKGWGRIVNVSSSSGKRPGSRNMAYNVAKAGMLSLSRSFADLYAAEGVLVNAVTPGATSTELWAGPGGIGEQVAGEGRAEEAIAAAAAKVPLGRLGTPEEVAAVIVFLCSERAGNVTGAAWSVDGGAVPTIL